LNDNRNMILAIVLSLLVLVGWSLLAERWFPQTQRVENGKVEPAPRPKHAPPDETPTTIRDRAIVLGESPRLKVETPSLVGSINLKGARFDDLELVRHRITIDPQSPPVRLLSPAGTRDAYFAGFGWVGQGIALPDANTLWTASAPILSPGKPVTLGWTNPGGQKFEQIVSVDDGYLFTVRQRVENRGTARSSSAATASPAAPPRPSIRASGRCTSGRWVSSTTRPITTSTGTSSTRLAPMASISTAVAAGSASPTNIG
jgi:YidC/Oxa1 family membrane protein insertase